jgi:hypothetical protein
MSFNDGKPRKHFFGFFCFLEYLATSGQPNDLKNFNGINSTIYILYLKYTHFLSVEKLRLV